MRGKVRRLARPVRHWHLQPQLRSPRLGQRAQPGALARRTPPRGQHLSSRASAAGGGDLWLSGGAETRSSQAQRRSHPVPPRCTRHSSKPLGWPFGGENCRSRRRGRRGVDGEREGGVSRGRERGGRRARGGWRGAKKRATAARGGHDELPTVTQCAALRRGDECASEETHHWPSPGRSLYPCECRRCPAGCLPSRRAQRRCRIPPSFDSTSFDWMLPEYSWVFLESAG